jgi:hypothetical protein
VSFSAGGKLLVTGCDDENAYLWDVAAIIKAAGLEELLSYSKADKSARALHANVTRRPIQQRLPAYRVPHGFFDGVPPAHSSAQQETTLLRRLFQHGPFSAQDTSPSSALDWARNIFKPRRQSGEEIELEGCSPTAVEVPYAKGKRRNASAREVALAKQKQKQKEKAKKLHSKNSTAGSSQPLRSNVTQPPSQPQSSSSTTPAAGDATAATTSTLLSHRHVTIRDAGLWTRFWLFLGCLSPEYTDSDH